MRNSLEMTRKVVAGAAALALIVSNVSVLPTASAASFSDVPMDAWYFDYVTDLVDMGVVSGNPDGTFRPDNSLNRAEMAKIAVNVAKISGVITSDDMSGATAFSDVAAGTWYYEFVAKASKNMIFEGYRDAQGNLTGVFGPGNTVNRAEASKVLLLAAGVPEMLTPGAPFMDVASTDWFYPYVTSAYNWSILDGYKTADGKLTGYFGPGDPVTRAQISKIAVLAQDPIDRYTGEHLNDMPTNGNTNSGNTNTNSGNTNTNVPVSNVSFEAAIARDANGNIFPGASTLATGTAFNTVTAINVTAGSQEDVNITDLTLMSRGFVSDSTISGVLVVDGEGKRHGNIVSFSSSKASINFTNNPIVVKAGTTQQLKIQLNFNTPAGFTSGTVGVEVTEIKAWGASTSGMVNVNFLENKPLMGNIHSLVTGSNIGNVTFDNVQITATAQDVDLGVKNKEASKFKITQANSQEDIMLTELTVFNNGNSGDTDIENIKLVDQNGAVLATVKNTTNRTAIFDLSANPYTIPKGTSRNLSILVDVINGSTRTIQFVVSNDYDIKVKGSTSQAFLLPAAGTTDTSFPIGDATGVNTLLIKEGVLTVSKATSSPSGEVSRGSTEVVIGEFKVEAAGEDIEIYGGSINVSTTSTTGDNELKGTFKVQNGSGTTLHSVNAVETAFDTMFDGTTGNGADVIARFNNPYTVKAGTTGTIRFVVDIADAATAGNTLQASLKDLLIKKISSNRTGTAATTTVTANAMTITAASLTVAKNSGFGDQNLVKGATSQKIGSVNLTTTNSEGVSVSSIVINLNDNSGVTNLKLMHNGAQIGSTIATPGTTSNTFGISGQLTIDKASSKSVDIYADVASSSAATSIVATIPASGISSTGLQSANSVSAPSVAVALQTNTVVANGNVTVSTTSSTSQSHVLTAGQAFTNLFSFNVLASNNEDMILQRAKVAIGNGDMTVTDMKLYKGDTLIAGPISLTKGIADFSGFNVTIPKNSTATFRVDATVISSGALDSDTEFLGGLYYYEVRGGASGALVQRYAGTELVGTDSAESYVAGDIVMAHDAGGNVGSLAFVSTAGTGGTTGTAVFTRAAAVDLNDAGDKISVLPRLTTETVVDSTNPALSYVKGDVVLSTTSVTAVAPTLQMVTAGNPGSMTASITNLSTTVTVASTARLTAGMLVTGTGIAADATVASVTNGTTFELSAAATATNAAATLTFGPELNNAAFIAAAAGGRISKLPVKQIEIPSGNAVDYALGEVALTSESGGAGVLAFVTTAGLNATSGNTAVFRAGGAAIDLNDADDIISTLPSLFTETAITGNPTVANWAVGDVVVFTPDVTATAPLMGVVTAVSATTVTIASDNAAPAVFTGVAGGGYIAKLFSARGQGNTMVGQDSVPTLSVAGTSPSGSKAPSSDQEVARFSVSTSGTRDVTLKTLNFSANGSYDSTTGGIVTNYELWNNGQKIANGTNAGAGACANATGYDPVGNAQCTVDTITFTLSDFTVTAGTPIELIVKANTSQIRADATTNTVSYSLQMQGTAARRDFNNGLTYQYTNGKSTPNTILTSYLDNYPITTPTLTY